MRDIAGKRFGRWEVLRFSNMDHGNSKWVCRCSCGTTRIKFGHALWKKNGPSGSCGCFWSEKNLTHGMCYTPEYMAWKKMKARCHNPKSNRYHTNGARGIRICKKWKNSFQNFINDVGKRPSKNHSIDRIDNNGNYTPSNCRWATEEQQANNKSTSVVLSAFGRKMTISQWSKSRKIPYARIIGRLRLGWSHRKALSKKMRFKCE